MNQHSAIVDRVIHVSAVVLRDRDGRVLNVRKRGTHMFMLPGGKPEPGEDAAMTAAREVEEELGFTLELSALSLLGRFRTAAANEPGYALEATVYTYPFFAESLSAAPQAEIAQLEWIDPVLPRTDLAPLNTEFVFPALLNVA
ncbi:8-oxo-dGTP pyrophosphatase MutT (NUDIX family) [Leucobacter exalbidus]|uniref:8-oxo-dGTP pyrophosphatase MutT (NUDIX family) n=1 Tax=Leucobacter exalbidus TaxID=662960 RepID=A0A940PQD1_9MICO|nr:8-oxo-dGTP pyrophosphatase MutT (NUDIX family) [Leucobacter exalbidus]